MPGVVEFGVFWKVNHPTPVADLRIPSPTLPSVACVIEFPIFRNQHRIAARARLNKATPALPAMARVVQFSILWDLNFPAFVSGLEVATHALSTFAAVVDFGVRRHIHRANRPRGERAEDCKKCLPKVLHVVTRITSC